ncbi:MAG: PAS domain-containing sensor histidine kinase [Endomicrobium sp.]|jgi:signal transduction histidine kinase|nr:PAS domain-containing sensor histidine kinase [Endomicrobium sp.]
MTEKVKNVTFFVIDRQGSFIYRNESAQRIVKENNAKELNNKTWENSTKVIREGKQFVFEETDKGKTFLSVKAPLVINGRVEGVIGLAVDITERRKAEELETKLKMQEELYTIAKEVAHDIESPISSLKMVQNMSKGKLSQQETKMLNLAVRSIEGMCGRLLKKYKCIRNEEQGINVHGADNEEDNKYILPYVSLQDIIESYRYNNKDRDIEFNCELDEKNVIFIKGNSSDFERMMMNIIKNAQEAMEGKRGIIKMSCRLVGDNAGEVEIKVKDEGVGMSRNMVDKLERGESIGTTRENGHGIGTHQMTGTIKAMNGKLKIESESGIGTEFILTFPKSDKPKWFADKIKIDKCDIIIVLDDDKFIHTLWNERLSKYKECIDVRYFTKGEKAIEYINTSKDKNRMFLITNYRLKDRDINGIDVVEKSGMERRHVVFTGDHISDIEFFNEKTEFLKVFNKINIPSIPLEIKK